MAGPSSSHPRPAGGFHPALPGRGHTMLAKALGACMWGFVFYRSYHDGPALIGLRHPWDGHGHGHGHGYGHGHADHEDEPSAQPGGIARSGPAIL